MKAQCNRFTIVDSNHSVVTSVGKTSELVRDKVSVRMESASSLCIVDTRKKNASLDNGII